MREKLKPVAAVGAVIVLLAAGVYVSTRVAGEGKAPKFQSSRLLGIPFCDHKPSHPKCVTPTNPPPVTSTTTPTVTVTTTVGSTTTPTTTTAPTTTTTPTTTTPVGSYFVGDFDTGDLLQWPGQWDVGLGTATATVAADGTSHSFAAIVDQLGGSSQTGEASFVQRNPGDSWETVGQQAWYRVKLLLPSGTNTAYPGKFTPELAPDGWNVLVSWHEFQSGPASIHFGVSTWGTLYIRWSGGPVANPSHVWNYDRNADSTVIPIVYDHWYDLLFHIVWDTDPSRGYGEIWIDGRQMNPPPSGTDVYGNPWPSRYPTLWTGGTVSPGQVHFQVGHYRKSPPLLTNPKPYYRDTVYIDNVRIGPTRSSVGG